MLDRDRGHPEVTGPTAVAPRRRRSRARRSRYIVLRDLGLTLLVGGLLLNAAANTIADTDLWGHIRFGQLTMRLGGVSSVDLYSYLTAGYRWINHEWLAEVIFAGVWDHFHTVGLVLLKTSMVLLVFGFVYAHLWRSGLGALRSGLLIMLFGVPTVLGLGSIRPQMFTYLFFVVTLLLIDAAEEGEVRWLWLLPPVFAAWVNLHGGVLAGVGVVGLWIAAKLAAWVLEHWRMQRGRGRTEPSAEAAANASTGNVRAPSASGALPVVLATGIAALAALLLNPYSLRLPLFLVRTATGPRPDIIGWHHLAIQSRLGAMWLAYLLVAMWTLWRSPRRPRPAILVLLFVLTLLPLTATRHLPLYGLAVPILLAGDLGAIRIQASGGRQGVAQRELTGAPALALGLLAGALGLAAAARSAHDFRCISLGPKTRIGYPTRAIGLLRESGVTGHLAVHFEWGEYAIWHLAPRLRVGMDGRRETVYPDSVYDAYLHFRNGTGDWEHYLDMGPADLALVPRGKPAYNLLSMDSHWTRVYGDSLAAVFGRNGSMATARVRATSAPDLPVDGRGLCFP